MKLQDTIYNIHIYIYILDSFASTHLIALLFGSQGHCVEINGQLLNVNLAFIWLTIPMGNDDNSLKWAPENVQLILMGFRKKMEDSEYLTPPTMYH